MKLSFCFRCNARRVARDYSASSTGILQHPAFVDLEMRDAMRGKFGVRHLPLFIGDSTFDRMGRVACRSGVVPRKELFECFATASYIHSQFNFSRVADVCSGHGLHSRMLMALADDDPSYSGINSRPRTAVCVDSRMPDSAEVIQVHMLAEFPTLANRWSYVESNLISVIPHYSTLITSVHACGSLRYACHSEKVGRGSERREKNQNH
jgi:hypothetical protein